ncbi:hypothetical protein PoB_002727600 [Plakobranchus ocellatus]|uniref:Peptidase A2 domain-containing protein n=1 Tax=Plakobranchus ocellatus TaxID=259542 RepID=A0AAV3ZXX5_9GAST|nr:hypothetical protein PoB_002727600 [Plakobranchus ocellatus]
MWLFREARRKLVPISLRLHIDREGRSNQQLHRQRKHYMDSAASATEVGADVDFNLFTVRVPGSQSINVPIQIQGRKVMFQLDTGAALTVITESDFAEADFHGV